MSDHPEMPPSPPEQPQDVQPSPIRPSPSPPSRPGSLKRGFYSLWWLVSRLVVLGVTASLGWMLGMVVAQVFPARNPDPPMAEVALRQVGQTTRRLRQLPQWWRGSVPDPIDLDPVELGNDEGVTDTPPDIAPVEPTAPEVPELSEEERQQLADDLTRLQQDLANLESRLDQLEETVCQTTTGTLAMRLQQLEQLHLEPELEPGAEAEDDPDQVDTAEAPEAEVAPPAAASTPVPFPEPRFPLVSDRIVLPSTLLFEPGSSTLLPAGEQLLDAIVSDLRQYPAATLLVGSHTAGPNDPTADRELTFRQAQVVQQYLEPQLASDRRRWVVVGYGQSRPRVISTSPEAQQRNQRIDIGIVPR